MLPAQRGIALIVPVHRAGPDLERCLRGIAALDPQPDELVMAVDGPVAAADPALRATLARAGLPVVVTAEAGGPARARNVGAATSAAEVLFFVDSDVVLEPDALPRLRRALEDADAVFGSYDDQPGHPGFTSQYKNLVHHLVHQRARREGTTFWGACGAVTRRAFDTVGGFDEVYRRPCVEDIELGYRLRAAGYRVVVEPALQVSHLKRWTVRGLLCTDIWDRAVPWTLLILRSRVVVDDLGTQVTARIQLLLTTLAVGALVTGALLTSWSPVVLAALCLAGVVLLDAPLLSGLARLRGRGFALRSVPWRLGHQLVCLSGMSIALVRMALQLSGLRAGPGPQLRADDAGHDLPGTARAHELHLDAGSSAWAPEPVAAARRRSA